MRVVQSEPVSTPSLATGRPPAGTNAPVRVRVIPAKPGEPMIPQFTRIASNTAHHSVVAHD
jgi:hypothetical protein